MASEIVAAPQARSSAQGHESESHTFQKQPSSHTDLLALSQANPVRIRESYSPLGRPPISPDSNQKSCETPLRDSVKRSQTPVPPLFDKYSALFDEWRKPQSNAWRWLSLAALVTTIVVSIPIGYSLRLQGFDITVDKSDTTGVSLLANLVDMDGTDQSMTIDWFVSDYVCDAGNASLVVCPDVNVYFDQNLMRAQDANYTPSNNVPNQPAFVINGSIWSSDDLVTASSAMFRTVLVITSADTHRTLQSYPFDLYSTQVFAFAAYDTGGRIPLNVTSSGIAIGFTASLRFRDGYEGSDRLYLSVSRGPVIRIYAVLIVAAIWLVTLTFMAACVSVVFLRRTMKAEVLVLPVATLFAFTQLRSSLPGAPPGFGANIDFVGILPCLTILTFCSVVMTAVFLFRDPEKEILELEKSVALAPQSCDAPQNTTYGDDNVALLQLLEATQGIRTILEKTASEGTAVHVKHSSFPSASRDVASPESR